MNRNSLRSAYIVGQLAAMAGLGRHLIRQHIQPLIQRAKRKGQQHPGSYRGCRKDKFASMTRQRRRVAATKKIMAEVRGKFNLPRRVMRAVVRTRVNREWRTA